MKKKVIISLCVLLTAVLLFPVIYHLEDGGTIEYKAILYSVQRVHRLYPAGSEQAYLDGTIVKILGFEVFNNVE